jgi:hypothetical protein
MGGYSTETQAILGGNERMLTSHAEDPVVAANLATVLSDPEFVVSVKLHES